MSNVTQGNRGNIAFLNASENIKQNNWYNFTATISDNGMTANIYNTNGTLIESLQNPYNSKNSNESIMLITNNVNNAVVFKDLTVQALNNTIQPLKSNEKTIDEIRSLFPYVSLSILLVATLSVTLVYVKKKRQMRQKNRNNVPATIQM
jgi:hypothetical protein